MTRIRGSHSTIKSGIENGIGGFTNAITKVVKEVPCIGKVVDSRVALTRSRTGKGLHARLPVALGWRKEKRTN